ncbi:hypothetical protein M407DRAFT_26729 [Tulasnella calospora MUT 4182]|uniref:Uncharacterized protein n=1 Tax=Tulasnella calospora MUT 4182 TaxID=1051891 RepID=A0A0C3QF96_9AGAM|nr:hypothetical protein M407DRAFT_26729 [Tulasnella calospora MUT 4182]
MDLDESVSLALNSFNSPLSQKPRPQDDGTEALFATPVSAPPAFPASSHIQTTVKKSARESPDHVKERTRLLELQADSVSSIGSTIYAEMPPPTISAPPNSVLWMKLIQSRWLLIQVKGFSIELWDVADHSVGKPLIACPAITGKSLSPHLPPSTNILTTFVSSYISYTFLLSLHIHCDCDTFVPQIVFWEGISGFSGLLDQRQSLYAFSRSVGRAVTGFVKDVNRNCAVQLRWGMVEFNNISDLSSESSLDSITDDSAFQLNEAHDILVREDVVAVARTYTLDLYSMPKITSILQGQSNQPTISEMVPYQSLVYPDIAYPIHQLSILRESNPLLTTTPDAIVLVSASIDGCYGVVATPSRSEDTPPSSSPFETRFVGESLMNMGDPSRNMFHAVWGPSGQRLATLSNTFLSVSFTVKGPKRHGLYGTTPRNNIAVWVIPGRLADMPLLLDFDEKTGVCAAAMASGRIWVMDATTYPDYGGPGYQLPKGFASETPETAKDLPDPNPEPFRWPLTMPPAPFGPNPSSDKPHEPAPGWSDEVDKYFPYKNQVEYYGSIPWFIQEVAHIPIRRDYQGSDGVSAGQAPGHVNKRVGPRPSCSRQTSYVFSVGVMAITKLSRSKRYLKHERKNTGSGY